MTTLIHTGDVVSWSREYRKSKDFKFFHSLLSDPPYNLESITKRFGKKGSKPARPGRDGAFQRATRGFMGSSWDTEIAFDPETWYAFSKLLYPGAFIMAFNGSRTFHRMVTAIEDAGFIIHPMVGWSFMNGFPKPTRIDTQIDAAAGIKVDKGKAFNYKGNVIYGKYADRTDVRYVAQTDMAKAWSGHRYGLQALKPAFEPICVAQLPYPGQMKPFESMVKTGAGCLNIDDTWIDGPEGYVQHNPVGQNGVFNASGGTIVNEGGRWPSHLILDESYVSWSEWANLDSGQGPNHENFYITDWMAEVLEDEDPLIYSAKASVAEREAGLDAMQRRMMNSGEDDVAFLEGSINDGRMAESDRPYLRNQTIRRNIHATIKPISLTRYLAKMLLPPEIYGEMEGGRRLFVPFAGVGSEMCGAQLAGWEHIEGVELEENHAFLAKIRTDYWLQHAGKLDFRVKKVSVPDGQQTLF